MTNANGFLVKSVTLTSALHKDVSSDSGQGDYSIHQVNAEMGVDPNRVIWS